MFWWKRRKETEAKILELEERIEELEKRLARQCGRGERGFFMECGRRVGAAGTLPAVKDLLIEYFAARERETLGKPLQFFVQEEGDGKETKDGKAGFYQTEEGA